MSDAETINTRRSQIPAVINKQAASIQGDWINFGCGKYPQAVDEIAPGAYHYDPHLTKQHIKQIRKDRPDINLVTNLDELPDKRWDTVICANVLNVIRERSQQHAVMRQLRELDADRYLISIYEGNKSGDGEETRDGYQENRPGADYQNDLRVHLAMDGYAVHRHDGDYTIKRRRTWANRITESGMESPEQILANPANYRQHPKAQRDALEGVLNEVGWVQEVIINRTTGHLIDGHLRVELAMAKSESQIPVKYVDLTEKEEQIILATIDPITALANQDQAMLDELLENIGGVGDEALSAFLDSLMTDEPEDDDIEDARLSLQERFIVPPFSVLDAKQGYWKDRKEHWLKLGIKSELGRGNEDDKTQRGLTFAVSCQPPQVMEFKQAVEKEEGRKLSWREFAERYPEELHLTGTSIFDPVLTEIIYSWFAPKGARILDPFAGGSVRGIVAGILGYRYTGIELRPEQVIANRRQADLIFSDSDQPPAANPAHFPIKSQELTPVQTIGGHKVKRDDLFNVAGIRGGKVRTCYALAQGAVGLVTAGSRQSPQVNIVASIAQHLGIPCSIHTPEGRLSPEVNAAVEKGAEISQHKAGYNNVIIARAREDAEARGWTEIPFGMECEEAVTQTRKQVANIPPDTKRIVVPVGSGMSLSGILHGLKDNDLEIPVLGVMVGADPTKRLAEFAPRDWRNMVELVEAGIDYHKTPKRTLLDDLQLDPNYESKCLPFLEEGDLLWIVGIRETSVPQPQRSATPTPEWIHGDARDLVEHTTGQEYDLIFTCPPYADLEVYSDNPADLSTLEYDQFLDAYRDIIAKAASKLKNDRFAVFVVGEVRGKTGAYYGFVQDTIRAFTDAGLSYYNEAVLLTNIGSNAMRAARMFNNSRKMVKGHQNALVFAKGDPDLGDISGMSAAIKNHFREHRQVFRAFDTIMIFCKGDPKAATEQAGEVVTTNPDELEALAVLDEIAQRND